MSSVKRWASAGSNQSGDCLVEVGPSEKDGSSLHVESIVLKAYGPQIRALVENLLRESGITGAAVYVRDRGAVDFVIKARVETAVHRAAKE